MKRICVYCGSRTGKRPAYAAAAEELGARLAQEKIELVYGGGCVGLMGVVANAALRGGGHVIGVIPQALARKEVVHEKLSDLRTVKTMHERKSLMAELADGFIALPGGYGTYEEFCEILTWSQLGWHHKPFGLLNVENFYQTFLMFLDHAADEGFIHQPNRDLVLVENNVGDLLMRLRQYVPPKSGRKILI
jgi:uncharacterized protein (TIGR00730 family)